MKQIFFKQIFFAICLLLLMACNKEESMTPFDPATISGETWPATDFDDWLDETFRVPYNIMVNYRWDKYIFGNDQITKNLVPPDTSYSRNVMEAILAGQINPYKTIVGADFVRKFIPKSYVLVGSYSWNSNGTITLGTAEGGKQVTIFGVNNFYRQSRAQVEDMLHTGHHEFAHILHQTNLYPPEFKKISVGNYTAQWNAVSDAQNVADSLGFISTYARANPDEDFVEMASYMLIWGKAKYETWIGSLKRKEAQAIIRQKEAIVVSYYKKTYDIDFYILQAAVKKAIDDYIAGI